MPDVAVGTRGSTPADPPIGYARHAPGVRDKADDVPRRDMLVSKSMEAVFRKGRGQGVELTGWIDNSEYPEAIEVCVATRGAQLPYPFPLRGTVGDAGRARR